MPIDRRTLITGFSGLVAVSALKPLAATAAMDDFRPQGQSRVDHDAFDVLLKKYVKPDAQGYNRVDYRGIGKNLSALKAYISALETVNPVSLSRNEAHAYWINLYNAKTLQVVAEAYPVTSIKKINLGGSFLFGSGPWKADILRVNGTDLSLDDVEHQIIRPLFRDEMSHYGLNCASYSCPNLATSAFTGTNIDALLRQNAIDYVNHPRGVTVKNGRITASKIYFWYAGDFGGKNRLKQHWVSLASPAKAKQIGSASIANYAYDWSINGIDNAQAER